MGATENRGCIVCGGSGGNRHWLGKWPIAGIGSVELAVRICSQCGAVFQDPAPRSDVMQRYYELYSNYTNVTRNGMPSSMTVEAAERQVSIIQKLLDPGHVFEVGCATGYTLAKLRDIGWQVSGCDPSGNATSIALTHWAIKTRAGFFEDLEFEEKEFDLIIFSHVLEHLYSPVSTLQKAFKWLSSTGSVVIEVPCLSNPEKWPVGYFTLEHLNYFSPAILSNCLAQAGFKIVYSTTLVDHPAYPVMTVVAQRHKPYHWSESSLDSPELIGRILAEHRKRELIEWARIEWLLHRELEGYKQVVIWGAGIHTSQLLSNTRIIGDKKLLSIVDSDPQKNGLELNGVRVVTPDSIDLSDDTLAIVISSRASEAEIFANLKSNEARRAKAIRLYADS